jgi:signal peptidase II
VEAAASAPSRGTRVFAYWSVVVLGVLVDQAVKAAVRATLAVGERAPLLPGVVELYRVENTGAAFSMGRGAGLLFVVVALVVVAVSLFLVWHESLPMPLVITVSAVAAGGVGNMLDRLASGSVTDFIATTFVSFPVFNVADILVTCGVFLSLVGYFVWGSRRSRLS